MIQLCELRVAELGQAGHKPLIALGNADPMTVKMYASFDPEVVRQYRMLRREADHWQDSRTGFMLARLSAGRHPDTDPTFWNGYKDPGPPELQIPLSRRIELWGRPLLGMGWFSVWGFLVRLPVYLMLFLGVVIVNRAVRRIRRALARRREA